MAYRNGETMRLEEARNLGIYPNGVLDIGAHSGQFYGWAKRVWPFMMDDEYLIAALGDEERDVTFYTRSDKPHTEGNSYYKESNYWDIPQLVQESKVTLQKLDNLFEDDSVFDIIKVDTQGSEIDILKGGKDLVSKAQAIILEVSFIPYNDGAPDSQETIEYMNEIGFEERMSVGEHYDGDTIVQKDLLFTNKELVK
mgnify:CR=1 FL=1